MYVCRPLADARGHWDRLCTVVHPHRTFDIRRLPGKLPRHGARCGPGTTARRRCEELVQGKGDVGRPPMEGVQARWQLLHLRSMIDLRPATRREPTCLACHLIVPTTPGRETRWYLPLPAYLCTRLSASYQAHLTSAINFSIFVLVISSFFWSDNVYAHNVEVCGCLGLTGIALLVLSIHFPHCADDRHLKGIQVARLLKRNKNAILTGLFSLLWWSTAQTTRNSLSTSGPRADNLNRYQSHNEPISKYFELQMYIRK